MRLLFAMWFVLAVSFCHAGWAMADDGPKIEVILVADGWTTPAPGADPADAEAMERLAQDIRLGPEPMSLSEVLDAVCEQTGVDVVVGWPALEIVGLDQASVVEVELDNVSAQAALRIVLEIASSDLFENDKLGYRLRDGVVMVSTVEELQVATEVRVYNVTPLFVEPTRPVGLLYEEDAFNDTIAFHAWRRGQRVYPFTDPMHISVYQQQILQMQDELDDLLELTGRRDDGWVVMPGGGGGGGGGLFAADERIEPEFGESYYERMEDLTELIQDSIGDPDAWLDWYWTIHEVDGRFVITTTRESHHAIEALLNSLLESEVDDQADIIRDAQVMQLLQRASEVQLDGGFEDALLLADRALLIDPDHVTARAMHRVLAETVERMRARDAADE